jgi:hypothetical protein
MPSTLIYARASTAERAETGHSIDDQVTLCKREAESRGFTLAGVYTDPGLSGPAPGTSSPAARRPSSRTDRTERLENRRRKDRYRNEGQESHALPQEGTRHGPSCGGDGR